MMTVVREKTKYHSFAFEFDFSQAVLATCRELKNKHGWQKFTFWEKKWRFEDPSIILELQDVYPSIILSSDVLAVVNNLRAIKQESSAVSERVTELKEKVVTDFRPDGIKGELYPYQNVGAEFLVLNRGRAILADDMGCISGDAMIDCVEFRDEGSPVVKLLPLRDLYKRFMEWPEFYFKAYSITDDGDIKRNRILGITSMGTKKVISITIVDNGEKRKLTLTPDHEVLTSKNKWIPAEKVTPGMSIMGPGAVWTMDCWTDLTKKEQKRYRADHPPTGYFRSFVAVPLDVVEVKEKKDVDVYDISVVGPNHSFVADDIVVHNCGKTLESLAYVTHTKNDRVLIVSPASVKPSWAKEVRKWTGLNSKIITSKSTKGDFEAVTPTAFIINYDILEKHLPTLLSSRWGCIICDEAHFLKSRGSKRTKAIKLLSTHCPSMIFLSGTPFLNRPEELFTLLNMVDPSEWSNYYEYTTKYCDGQKTRWGWQAKGATNLLELQERISKYFLRRTKKDILPDLPPKVFIDTPVKFDIKIQKEYDFAENAFIEYLKEMKNKTNYQLSKMNYATEKLVQLGVLRAITTRGKIEAAKDLIDSIVNSGEKVVVFSCYNEPLEYFKELYGESSVMITGKTKLEDRGEAVDRFQADPNCKVFIGGIKSAGVGITLTAASNVIFLDYSWTPADHSQAMDRCNRIGQKNSVNVYQLYAESTIDETMTELLAKKKFLFDVIIEGTPVEELNFNLVDELINKFKDVDKSY